MRILADHFWMAREATERAMRELCSPATLPARRFLAAMGPWAARRDEAGNVSGVVRSPQAGGRGEAYTVFAPLAPYAAEYSTLDMEDGGGPFRLWFAGGRLACTAGMTIFPEPQERDLVTEPGDVPDPGLDPALGARLGEIIALCEVAPHGAAPRYALAAIMADEQGRPGLRWGGAATMTAIYDAACGALEEAGCNIASIAALANAAYARLARRKRGE